jgi:hypothetical protein
MPLELGQIGVLGFCCVICRESQTKHAKALKETTYAVFFCTPSWIGALIFHLGYDALIATCIKRRRRRRRSETNNPIQRFDF